MSLNDLLRRMSFAANLKTNEDCVKRGRGARVGDSGEAGGGGGITCSALPLDGKCFTMQPSDVEEGTSTRVQLINHISFLM